MTPPIRDGCPQTAGESWIASRPYTRGSRLEWSTLRLPHDNFRVGSPVGLDPKLVTETTNFDTLEPV